MLYTPAFFDSKQGNKGKYPHCQRQLKMMKEINAIERFNFPINFSFLLSLPRHCDDDKWCVCVFVQNVSHTLSLLRENIALLRVKHKKVFKEKDLQTLSPL